MIREIYAGTESGEEVNIYYDKPIKLVDGRLMGARIIGTVNAGILPSVNPQNSPVRLLLGIKKPVKTDDNCLYMARDRDIEEDGHLYPGRIAIYHGMPELKDGKFTGVVLCEPDRYYFTFIRHDASPVSLDLDTDSLDT